MNFPSQCLLLHISHSNCPTISTSLSAHLFFPPLSIFLSFTLPPSLQHGADPTKKNRDGNTPLDLVKDGDTDIQDLLRGDAALLDAAKKGCLARVQKLCSPDNINCRDTQGRNSTPLHLAGNLHKETPNKKLHTQTHIK